MNPETAYVVALIASVPLAMVSPMFGSGRSRHVYHVVVGLVLAWAVSGADLGHALVSTAGAFAILKVLPRRFHAAVCFLWAFAYQLAMRTLPSPFTGLPLTQGPANALQLILTLKIASVGQPRTHPKGILKKNNN